MPNKLKTELQESVVAAANVASKEIGELRRKGHFICDITYIVGAMQEATMKFCNKHGIDPRAI